MGYDNKRLNKLGRKKHYKNNTTKTTHLYTSERTSIGVDDLVLLPTLNEVSILENLKLRHAADIIYSYIGNVLIVVNPYKWLPIYDEQTMLSYCYTSRIDVPPHVFATAEAMYRTMLSDEENQCVIISGESGAGKTEASKQIQNYIATISGSGDGVDKIKRTFLESNPLLEAFGNAKTLRNNNSSRFGKYFELYFDTAGRPQGGKVTNYLLEKSRIVHPGQGERNFHIFYQLLAGLPIEGKRKLRLSNVDKPQDFEYLKCSNCYSVTDVNDAKDFEETVAAMSHVGIKRKQVELILQTLAGILHIGNIKFESLAIGNAEGSKIVKSSEESLIACCELLGLEPQALIHALTFKRLQTMAPGGKIEEYEVPQNESQATAHRDSLAKAIYERLFDFLVERINHALDIDRRKQDTLVDASQCQSIGILDIYGFEIFEKNGFEQFCINYVNEKLQQLFIELTLRSEQEEYAREGIAWTPIPFFNNQIVCDLIDCKTGPAPGLFLILDDTVKTMHSREGASIDASFLEKAVSFHGKHPHFSKRGRIFSIKHYAGDVQYHIDGFGDTNKDALSQDMAIVIADATQQLIQYIFPEEIDIQNKKLPTTAGTKIRTQSTTLISTLMDCTPHYVRCIKSNDQKQRQKIDDQRVIHQVKYLGLLENIKVRRAGYAYHTNYGRFVDRFRLLSKDTYPILKVSDKKGCQAILRAAVKSGLKALETEVQMGKTMVFIQSPQMYFALEGLRDAKISGYVSKIQKAWLKYQGRRELLTLRHEMLKLYTTHKKERMRGSIYRPFDRDYLLDSSIRENMLKILRFYGDNETILFLDFIKKVYAPVSKSTDGTHVQILPRLLLVTEEFAYIMETHDDYSISHEMSRNQKNRSGFIQPQLTLCRRIPLNSVTEISLSPFADPYMIVRVNQPPKLEKPDASNWVDDKSTLVCPATGKKFGLFNRRHHCRLTGEIFHDDVLRNLAIVPDRGYYTPVRVYDKVLGMQSSEMMEDQLWRSEKKTEIVAVIVDTIRTNLNKKIPIQFKQSLVLRTSQAAPHLSCSPSQSMTFLTPNPSKSAISTTNFGIFSTEQQLEIATEKGVPEEYIRKRRKRERARRKRMELERLEELERRAIRQKQREEEREKERIRRVAEKKAKKMEEKEKRRLRTQSGSSRRLLKEKNIRQFGEAASSQQSSHNHQKLGIAGNASSELAAILARRRGET